MNTSRTIIRGFIKIVGIITLALSAIMLLVAALSLLIAALLNQTGLTNAPFQVGSLTVTGFPQLIVALLVSAALFMLSALCRKGIRKLGN